MRLRRTLPSFLATIHIAAMPLAARAIPQPAGSLSPYLVGLSVANVDSSTSWYTRVLGFAVMRPPYAAAPRIRIAFLIREDFRLELIQFDESVPRRHVLPDTSRDFSVQGFLKIGFRVRNVDSVATALKAVGVPIVFGPASDSSFAVRHLLAADQDGNLIQLFQPLAKRAAPTGVERR